jgi:DNA invertase Pin-like site-specific DNA recombinase
MAETDKALVETARAVLVALEESRSAMAASADLMKRYIEGLEAGEDVVEIVRSNPVGKVRTWGVVADAALADARTRFRVKIIEACVTAGMSQKEIASNMKSSRQLVARYIKKPE